MLAIALLVASLANAGSARADTRSGALADVASAGDYYQVTCSNDGAGAPASLSVQVQDVAPVATPIVSVQARRANAATNSSDDTDGDTGASPLVFVNGGAGAYDVFVDKTAAGVESYVLTYTCMTGANGGGVRTGTAITASSVAAPVPALGFAATLCFWALMLLGLARGVSAHTQSGALGDAASATDYYQVTCSNDGTGAPASLSMQVQDAAPPAAPLVSVQVRKALVIANTTDPADGDAGLSPIVHVNGGAGVYDVLVDKSGAGAETYTLTFHCMTGPNGTGTHTGTGIVTLQSQ